MSQVGMKPSMCKCPEAGNPLALLCPNHSAGSKVREVDKTRSLPGLDVLGDATRSYQDLQGKECMV